MSAELQRSFDAEEVWTVYVGRPAHLKCIWLLTKEAWDSLDSVYDDPRFMHVLDEGPRSNYFRHSLSSFRAEQIVNGRVPLSEVLLLHADLDPRSEEPLSPEWDGRAMVIGMGRRIEIWHPQHFAATLEQPIAPPSFMTAPTEQPLTKQYGQGGDDFAS